MVSTTARWAGPQQAASSCAAAVRAAAAMRKTLSQHQETARLRVLAKESERLQLVCGAAQMHAKSVPHSSEANRLQNLRASINAESSDQCTTHHSVESCNAVEPKQIQPRTQSGRLPEEDWCVIENQEVDADIRDWQLTTSSFENSSD